MVSHGRDKSLADDEAFDGMLEQVAIVGQDTRGHRSLEVGFSAGVVIEYQLNPRRRKYASPKIFRKPRYPPRVIKAAPSICLSSAACASN